ncbi:MAG: hypothetical protein WD627_07415 [Actinomycetota bacterium]
MNRTLCFRATVLVLVLALTACQSDSPDASESPAPTPTESSVAEVEYDTCTNTVSGYSIDYPENWTISTGEYACRWADQETFVVAPASEGPSTAIMVFDSPDEFDKVVNGTFDDLFYRTNLREDTIVAEHRAVKFDVTATGEGLGPDGSPSYGYVIDRDGKGFVVSTEQLPGDTGYEEDKRALDEAVKTLKFLEEPEE